MTLESLKILNDEQLQAVIARAGELLKQHDRERKEKALADARTNTGVGGVDVEGHRREVRDNESRKASFLPERASLPSVKAGADLECERPEAGMVA
jgi:hypothetical protein